MGGGLVLLLSFHVQRDGDEVEKLNERTEMEKEGETLGPMLTCPRTQSHGADNKLSGFPVYGFGRVVGGWKGYF